jgi:hypothetical protein
MLPAADDPEPELDSDSQPEAGYDDLDDLLMIDEDIRKKFEVHSWRNAATILTKRHARAYAEIAEVLRAFRLQKSHLTRLDDSGTEVAKGGGRKSLVAAAVDGPLTELGWAETLFSTSVVVEARRQIERFKIGKRGRQLTTTEKIWEAFDTVRFEAPTHKVDCYKERVALEVEWNNKNPFFDRDLNNFRLLFELRVVQVGVIVTRCDELDDVFKGLVGAADARERYGATTTRMSKLVPLVKGGGGGGCPVLIFGISKAAYDENS